MRKYVRDRASDQDSLVSFRVLSQSVRNQLRNVGFSEHGLLSVRSDGAECESNEAEDDENGFHFCTERM